MNKIKINFFAVFALGAFFAVFQSNPALAECRAFPKLDFWGNMSHASVQNYVDNRLYGDWGGYIVKLENIRNGLEKIHRRNRGAVLKLKGRSIKLRGVKLAYYIQKSNERIAVVRCLADVSDIAGLQNFATAAGGNDTRAGSSYFPDPDKKSEEYRTLVTLPLSLVAEMRKRATQRSFIENRKVSVNDIIARSLRRQFAN